MNRTKSKTLTNIIGFRSMPTDLLETILRSRFVIVVVVKKRYLIHMGSHFRTGS